MLAPRVNYRILFTGLALLVYPRQGALLAMFTLLVRTTLLFIPLPFKITSATDNFGCLLFLSATLVLALHSAIGLVRILLFWSAQNVHLLLPEYSASIWIVGLVELMFLIFRAMVFSLSLLMLNIGHSHGKEGTRPTGRCSQGRDGK